MGQEIFDVDGDFTVPVGITTITVCMIGGGAGGSGGESSSNGGGYAGTILTQEYTVVPEAIIPISIGGGGAGGPDSGSNTPGSGGGASTLGTLTAPGASGGYPTYSGDGATTTNCAGTFTDGLRDLSFGGQAGFSNGPNGKGVGTTGGIGVLGCGGSGGGSTAAGGAGGSGRVIINWDDASTGGPEFRINGTIIDRITGQVTIDGAPVHRVMQNGLETWFREAAPGQAVFNTPGVHTFVVPELITELQLCACGGGTGGGNNQSSDAGQSQGGPRASYSATGTTLAVTAGETLSITIGSGGAGRTSEGAGGGAAGTDTIIVALAETLTYAGGPTGSYLGNGGGAIATCAGTYTDGTYIGDDSEQYAYGGQAGCFGNGGNGGKHANAGNGGPGAGGGGGYDSGAQGGDGGNGQVVFNWG